MPTPINCKYYNDGKCEKLPRKFFIFKRTCIKHYSTQKCLVAERCCVKPPPHFSPHPRERQPKQESMLPRSLTSTSMPKVKRPVPTGQFNVSPTPELETLKTLRLIEEHLSEIASCVKPAPLHGTGNVIKTANWNT